VDTEDDLQPLVFSMFRDATRAVNLMAAATATVDFDPERLEALAADGWTTLTELADALVREHGVPFRTAHRIVARLVPADQRRLPGRDHAGHVEGDKARPPLADRLAEVSAEVLGSPLIYSETALAEILSPRHFVRVRKTPGGPAPEETAQAVPLSLAELEADRSWWTNTTRGLSESERRLRERVAAL
jgi:argininosuccinate lyase